MSHSLLYEMQNKNRKSGKESHPTRVLFIGPSKTLKDYNAHMT
jgi:hypothetical protein